MVCGCGGFSSTTSKVGWLLDRTDIMEGCSTHSSQEAGRSQGQDYSLASHSLNNPFPIQATPHKSHSVMEF